MDGGGASLLTQVSPKIASFIAENDLATPCLVFDVARVEANFGVLREVLGETDIFYAVKANPAEPVLRRLVDLGSKFEASSWEEIELCLRAGARAEDITFGNTVKRPGAIARAAAAGIDAFAFDSDGELEKIAAHAPGAGVYCRVIVDNKGADWPLSRKFGTTPAEAARLLRAAGELGLRPFGVSFHVGSQQTSADAYVAAIATVAPLFRDQGLGLTTLNLGGGFPAPYRDHVPDIGAFAAGIREAVAQEFAFEPPRLVIEPGRFIVADAGVVLTEVLLVSRRVPEDVVRWVYLDIGRFGGLAETEGEAIRYRVATPHDGTQAGPVVIAGPTCDGADVLYEASGYRLPLALGTGDRVALLSTGAYVTSYASVCFNGFAPLAEHYV